MSDDLIVRAKRTAVGLRTWDHPNEANLMEDLAEEVGTLRATIERFSREVDLIGAHRIDWEDNGPTHDEWLASFGERRLGGPDIAYRGIQYAVARLRRALKGES